MRRIWRILRWLLALALAGALALTGWAYLRLRATLPGPGGTCPGPPIP